MKRRCLYHWIDYPTAEREEEIVLSRLPGVSETLAAKAVAAVNRLRGLDLAKPPGVAETIDWVEALQALGAGSLDVDTFMVSLGSVIKDRDDLEVAERRAGSIVDGG